MRTLPDDWGFTRLAGNMRVRELRQELAISRAVFARFLGVSEATIARWESSDTTSEPRGLSAVLLHCLADACRHRPPREVARIVRSCAVDHRAALRELLCAADVPPGQR